MQDFDIEAFVQGATNRKMRELEQQSRMQAQQQVGVQSYAQGLGGLGAGLAGGHIGMAPTPGSMIAVNGTDDIRSWTSTTTGITDDEYPISSPPSLAAETFNRSYTSPEPAGYSPNVITFNRINKRVSIHSYEIENRVFEEPLDELRIEVAQWLN